MNKSDLAAALAGSSLNLMRSYIFAGMVFVSLIPIVLVMQNAYEAAFRRETAKVEQAHLIIAQNLTATLQRYAADAVSAFDFVTADHAAALDPAALDALLRQYEFRYVGVVPAGAARPDTLYTRGVRAPGPETIGSLRDLAGAEAGATRLSGVRQIDGEPVFYLARRDASGALAIGVFDTRYVVAQQQAIAFGQRGHAMIVDQDGRVLAHPKPEWTRTSKDASGLEVVQRMITGQTGVMQFFSPPLQADMIAGYTQVPTTGWGVMVPQPVAELRAAARVEAGHVIKFLGLLCLLALVVSWVVSGLIARPIDTVSRVVMRVRDGDLSARVPAFDRVAPRELVSLRAVLNGLLDSWSETRALLERSLEAAREANATKSRAISVLSHEMRTPLNGIVGAVDLMGRTPLSTAQAGYLDIMETASRTLLGHVDRVLDVSRLEESSVVVEAGDVDLRGMLQDIVTENSAQAQKSGNRITLSVCDAIPRLIRTDPRMLRTVAANLVGNAVKFTKAGQVDIRVALAGDGHLELRVDDNGPGINQSDMPRLFEPFSVVNASYGRSEGGTGLGLCIVAMSVEALGGTLDVKSAVGVGCTFLVRLPFEPAGQAVDTAPASALSVPLQSAASARRVLVVDDNEINRTVLSEMLWQLGHAVSVAVDGPDALQIAMAQPFDLILLDISMPGLDGTEVAFLLRDHEGPNQKTRIVAQTAHASPADRDRFAAAGIDHALIKPIAIKDLDGILQGGAPVADAAPGTLNPATMRPLDPDRFELLVAVKGAGGAVESLQTILRETGQIIGDLDTVPAGRRDVDTFLKRVHNLVGATAMLGAELLHARLHAIESRLKRDGGAALDDLVPATREALGMTRDAAGEVGA